MENKIGKFTGNYNLPMRRRDFLQNVAITTMGVSLTAFTPQSAQAAKPVKKIFLTGGGFDLTT